MQTVKTQLIEAERALAEAHALGHTHKFASLKARVRTLRAQLRVLAFRMEVAI